MITVEPFHIAVPQARLDRIAARLALSEPGYAPHDDADWNYGTDARWLGELLDHWRNCYDWRVTEARLNTLPHFQAQIDGIAIHFIHFRATGSACPKPLLLTHGWPGSFLEFIEAGPMLAARGFDVVIPSLPGYAFSGRPQRPIGPRAVAVLWRKLMVEALGYAHFFAQGGDWGSGVTTALGTDHADVVDAIHLNLFFAPAATADDDAEATAYRQALAAVQTRESAYMMEQATKPQTIGLALADSPIGFAAWVCEKFHGWGDTGGQIGSRFSNDQLLDNIMLYLVNDAVQSSIWMYRSIFEEQRQIARVEVPTGLALYPAEFMPYPPPSAAQRAYNVQHWAVMSAGGHFAAMEEPVLFCDDVESYFRSVSPFEPLVTCSAASAT